MSWWSWLGVICKCVLIWCWWCSCFLFWLIFVLFCGVVWFYFVVNLLVLNVLFGIFIWLVYCVVRFWWICFCFMFDVVLVVVFCSYCCGFVLYFWSDDE